MWPERIMPGASRGPMVARMFTPVALGARQRHRLQPGAAQVAQHAVRDADVAAARQVGAGDEIGENGFGGHGLLRFGATLRRPPRQMLPNAGLSAASPAKGARHKIRRARTGTARSPARRPAATAPARLPAPCWPRDRGARDEPVLRPRRPDPAPGPFHRRRLCRGRGGAGADPAVGRAAARRDPGGGRRDRRPRRRHGGQGATRLGLGRLRPARPHPCAARLGRSDRGPCGRAVATRSRRLDPAHQPVAAGRRGGDGGADPLLRRTCRQGRRRAGSDPRRLARHDPGRALRRRRRDRPPGTFRSRWRAGNWDRRWRQEMPWC